MRTIVLNGIFTGDANLLLSKYPQESGFITGIDHVTGHTANGQSHAWLGIGNGVLDISADEFIRCKD